MPADGSSSEFSPQPPPPTLEQKPPETKFGHFVQKGTELAQGVKEKLIQRWETLLGKNQPHQVLEEIASANASPLGETEEDLHTDDSGTIHGEQDKAETTHTEEIIDPLTHTEKRTLLKPETLAKLSTEEYINLWKRLNPYFVSHATRQGFRDHAAMVYHTKGIESYHNGFTTILEDEGNLRPPIYLAGLKDRSEASVTQWLSDWVLEAPDKDEALQRFNKQQHVHFAAAPKYPDKTAVHFAAQVVANDYYGGETGNEVFFIFPSDVIASQYTFAFNGWQKDFTKPQSETKWNDVFVWPQNVDNPGVPVDAGMVFLPASARVDPETGSKYASEIKMIDGKETRVMVEDSELIDAFQKWGGQDFKDSVTAQAYTTYKSEQDYYSRQTLLNAFVNVCSSELQNLGFDQSGSIALTDELLNELAYRDELTDDNLLHIIHDSGAHWKRAENSVSSKEYWEQYFSKHPDHKPAHIQYYNDDPTTAVFEFQKENGIGAGTPTDLEDPLLGYEDQHITDMEHDPRANRGYQELVNMAQQIIAIRYTT